MQNTVEEDKHVHFNMQHLLTSSKKKGESPWARLLPYFIPTGKLYHRIAKVSAWSRGLPRGRSQRGHSAAQGWEGVWSGQSGGGSKRQWPPY